MERINEALALITLVSPADTVGVYLLIPAMRNGAFKYSTGDGSNGLDFGIFASYLILAELN